MTRSWLIQLIFIYCRLLKSIFLIHFLLLLKARSSLNSVKYKLFYQFPVNVRILWKVLIPFTTSSFILFLLCVDFYIFQTRYITFFCVIISLFYLFTSLTDTFFFFQKFGISYWNHFPLSWKSPVSIYFFFEEFCCRGLLLFLLLWNDLHLSPCVVIFLQGTEFWWDAIFFHCLRLDFPL